MPSLLAIDVSPRFEHSVSRELTGRFIEHWQAVHPGGNVIRRDLIKARPSFVDGDWITSAFTPEDRRSSAMRDAIRESDELTAEFMAADHVVIGTPIFNFSIPAVLKAYIDQIVRVGVSVTARYEGLAVGTKATVILASGGDAGTSRDGETSAAAYLRQILGFLGIADVTIVHAPKTLAIDTGQTTFGEFAARFERQLATAAGA